jgi:hypothetical protein
MRMDVDPARETGHNGNVIQREVTTQHPREVAPGQRRRAGADDAGTPSRQHGEVTPVKEDRGCLTVVGQADWICIVTHADDRYPVLRAPVGHCIVQATHVAPCAPHSVVDTVNDPLPRDNGAEDISRFTGLDETPQPAVRLQRERRECRGTHLFAGSVRMLIALST